MLLSRCVRLLPRPWVAVNSNCQDTSYTRSLIVSISHNEKGKKRNGIAAMVGTPIKRREDPRLITGQATYVDDITLLGMLHMAVLRSPYGHARIKSINTEAARKHP